MKTSILICTYNRGSLINKTLYCLIKRQTVKPNEIVVVNGGGENNCKHILQKWKITFPKLKIKETQNINLATSRNKGLSICSGDIILFTDDDARPYPDWVEKIKKAYEIYPDACAIGGNVINIRKILLINTRLLLIMIINPNQITDSPKIRLAKKRIWEFQSQYGMEE